MLQLRGLLVVGQSVWHGVDSKLLPWIVVVLIALKYGSDIWEGFPVTHILCLPGQTCISVWMNCKPTTVASEGIQNTSCLKSCAGRSSTTTSWFHLMVTIWAHLSGYFQLNCYLWLLICFYKSAGKYNRKGNYAHILFLRNTAQKRKFGLIFSCYMLHMNCKISCLLHIFITSEMTFKGSLPKMIGRL